MPEETVLIPPLKCFIAEFTGTACKQEAAAEQIELGATVHGVLQQLEATDLSVRLPTAPGQAKAGAHGGAACIKTGRKALDNADAAATRRVQPSIKGDARIGMDLPGAAAAANDPAEAAGEVDDLPASLSWSTRATRAVAAPSMCSGSPRTNHDSCFGEGSGGDEDGVTIAAVGADCHRRTVVLAGRVRRSPSQRPTCFGVPGKPSARSSRQSCMAFSQPASRRACKWSR